MAKGARSVVTATVVAALVVVGFAGAAGAATSIPIDNPGFEAATYPDGGGSLGITGAWTAPGVQGEFNPHGYQITGEAFEGDNVAFSNETNGVIGQVLTSNLEAGHRYTLSVQVGERKEGVPSGHRPYEVQLLAGGVVLGSTTTPEQVFDGWVQAEVVYDAAAGDPQIGLPLEIRLISGGVQLLWDDVQLTSEVLATPPSTRDACKKGGWVSFTDDEGTPFRNQGDCVSYVVTAGTNKANG